MTKTTLAIVGGFVGFVALVLVVLALAGVFEVAGQKQQAIVSKATAGDRVTQRTFSTDNAFNAVAFFHNTCNDAHRDANIVRSNLTKQQADERAAKLETDPLRQQQALDRLDQDNQAVAGAKQQLQDDAASYNAKSANYTQSPFKDEGLPYRIDPPSDDESLANYAVNCG